MEKERISREKSSRIIQSKSGKKEIFNMRDNRSDKDKKDQNYLSDIMCQRKVDVAQMAPADKKFEYYPNLVKYENRIPYKSGMICFTPYSEEEGEVRSAGFSGCFMMAFRFNSDFDRYNQVVRLLTNNNQHINTSKVYIAHVANNAKESLYDAEKRGLIFIEAIYRPYRSEELDYPAKHSSQENVSDGKACVNNLTGGLSHSGDGWMANVYYQEKKYHKKSSDLSVFNMDKFNWENKPVPNRSLDSESLKEVTLATKAFIYASVAGDSKSSLSKSATEDLKRMASNGGRALVPLALAKNLLVNSHVDKDVAAKGKLEKMIDMYRN